MSDNLQQTPDATFALPDRAVLMLEGRDAMAFAHAQFMNDVATLPAGTWQWNGWLTPKGRLLELFALVVLDPERVCLVLCDGDPMAFADQLRVLVFRRRVSINPRDDLHAGGRFAAPHMASGNMVSASAGSFELDMGSDRSARTLSVGNAPLPADANLAQRWKVTDVEHGLPRLPPSQRELWTPQQLSLDRLQAYSVKKGCYPGQEIVARTHFLGQAKRGLVLLEARSEVVEGGDVSVHDQAIGTIISVAPSEDRWLALAVLPFARERDGMRAGTIELIERPLQGGLAR